MLVGHLPYKALAYVNDEVLVAAAGRFLEFWSVAEGKRLSAAMQVSDRNPISGLLVVSSTHILVSAGRQLLLVHYTSSYQVSRDSIAGYQFGDRIVNLEPLDEDRIIVTLSHCQTIIFSVSRCNVERTFCLESNYLIYSSCVLRTLGKTLVAFGTVFDGVEIFELDTERGRLVKRIRLRGHEGSIFGLCAHASNHCLVSCSDDRTVRLWRIPSIEEPSEQPIDLCAEKIMVGHGARVWRVRFHHDTIISAAEDSTVRLWDLQGVCQNILRGHRGLNIWAVACRNDWLVSGGDDCSLRRWPLDDSDQPRLNCLGHQGDAEPKCFAFVEDARADELAVLYANGSVSGFDCQISRDRIDRHAVFRAFPSRRLFIFGNLAGEVHIQHDTHTAQFDLGFNAKVVFLEAAVSGNRVTILAQSGHGVVALLVLSLSLDAMPSATMIKDIGLRDSIVCCVLFRGSGDLLLLGTRDGRILLYRRMEGEIRVLARVGRDAVTCIRAGPQDDTLLLVTDRSGTLSCHRLDPATPLLSPQWSSRMTKSWLEQVDVLPNGDIYVAGFESTVFFLKCHQTGQTMLQLTTGGAHRFWRLQFFPTERRVSFGFVRLGRLYWCSKSLDVEPSVIIRAPLHGAEIRAVASSPHQDHLITGGEDGRLVVTRVDVAGADLLVRASFVAHRSGIKAVICHEDLVFSAGSSEELLCHRRLSDGNLQQLAKANAVSKVRDIRIMSIATHVANGSIVVAAACSDSFVRTWRLDRERGQLLFTSELEAHPGHCVLVVAFCDIDASSMIVTGGTDGMLCICSDPQALKLVCQSRIHQSGINAISIRGSTIATGGDDGRLCLQSLSPSASPSASLWNLQSLDAVPEANHSTITGLAWIDDMTLASVSIDQLVKIWRLDGASKLRQWRAAVMDVADPAAMTIMQNHFVIVGAGLQLFPLDRVMPT